MNNLIYKSLVSLEAIFDEISLKNMYCCQICHIFLGPVYNSNFSPGWLSSRAKISARAEIIFVYNWLSARAEKFFVFFDFSPGWNEFWYHVEDKNPTWVLQIDT